MADTSVSRLTRKEKEFAAAIAGGATLAGAYAKVYSDRAGRRAAEANARQVLKRGRVAHEIERLRRFPPPDDFAAIRQLAIGKLLEVAHSDPNAAARHRALTSLLAHAEGGLHKRPLQQGTSAPVNKVESAKLLAELRQLYQKAGLNPAKSAIEAPRRRA